MFYMSTSTVENGPVKVCFDLCDKQIVVAVRANAPETAALLRDKLNEAAQGPFGTLRECLEVIGCSQPIFEQAYEAWEIEQGLQAKPPAGNPMTIGEAIVALVALASGENGEIDLTTPLCVGLPDGYSVQESGVTGFRVAWDANRPGGAIVVVEPIQDDSANGGGSSEFRLINESGNWVYRRR